MSYGHHREVLKYESPTRRLTAESWSG